MPGELDLQSTYLANEWFHNIDASQSDCISYALVHCENIFGKEEKIKMLKDAEQKAALLVQSSDDSDERIKSYRNFCEAIETVISGLT